MALYMMDLSGAPSLTSSASPPQPQPHALSLSPNSTMPPPPSSTATQSSPFASQLAALGLPPGTIALPGPNGTILWAAPGPSPSAPPSYSQQSQPQPQQQQSSLVQTPYGLLPTALLELSAAVGAPQSAPLSGGFSLNGAASSSPLSSLHASLSQMPQPLAAASHSQLPKAFQPSLPLSSLNLSSLLPYATAPQPVAPVQPLGGGKDASSAASAQASSSALLQLQATLLQVAQTGNTQAIQQLQGLNALMTQFAQSQPQPLPPSAPPAKASLHLSPFAQASSGSGSDSNGGGCGSSGYNSAGTRSTSVSPLTESAQDLSPPSGHRLLISGASAFKPRGKRDREDSRGGNGTTSGSASGGNSSSGSAPGSGSGASHHRHLSAGRGAGSRAQALKSSQLRADVREAVAASHLQRSKGAAGAKDDSSSSSGGQKSSSTGSSSSDEEQRCQEADDETDSERETKRRRRKISSAAPASSSPPSTLKPHPLHLFSSLDALQAGTWAPAQTQPAASASLQQLLPEGAKLTKDQHGQPFVYLHNPQLPSGPAGNAQPISQQMSHLALLDVDQSGHEVQGDASRASRAAALSALSSLLQSHPSVLTLPPQAALNAPPEPVHSQQLQFLHQLRQASAPSAINTPATSSPSGGLHGVPLHLVSQQFSNQQQQQQQQQHGVASESGGNGSSGAGIGVSSGNHSGTSHAHSSVHGQSPDRVAPLAEPLHAPVGPGGKKLRKKHIVTDRQRRAKIKDGMEQLRSLLSNHGSFTSDQVSIMTASVQLIQQLRGEVSLLKSHTGQMRQELDHYKHTFGALSAIGAQPSTATSSSPASSLLSALGLDAAQLAALGVEGNVAPSADDAGDKDLRSAQRLNVKDESTDSNPSLSPTSSPSRSPSLVAPMAAMSMQGGRAGADGSSSDSADGSTPSPLDARNDSPAPPTPDGDSREDDDDSQASSSTNHTQSDDERSSPEPSSRTSSDASASGEQPTASEQLENSTATTQQEHQPQMLAT